MFGQRLEQKLFDRKRWWRACEQCVSISFRLSDIGRPDIPGGAYAILDDNRRVTN